MVHRQETNYEVVPINPGTLAEPAGHFDRAVRIGPWLFISGTSALTNLSGTIEERRMPEDFREQANIAFDNIEKVLHEAGATFEHVYEIRTMLSDAADFGVLNELFRERMPGRGFIGHGYVTGFLAPGMKIEIEANAYLPGAQLPAS
ncbi:RidA family protein [Amycolatopsis orientalis]|uniref:RidA family protein n=1 Tax=Amycolatopsis orientalis TaxID=31958 RepID=UPI0003A0A546|nr:Rid family hydrolase [Amycolatopsis orientalis]